MASQESGHIGGLGKPLKTQSGCFCQNEHLASVDLTTVARAVLAQEQRPVDGAALMVSPSAVANVVRVAFDVSQSKDIKGWNGVHRGLAQALSQGARAPVHAYLFMPWEGEEVGTFAAGRKVGGDRVVYLEEEPEDDDVVDDEHFARLQDSWPLGRLARVLGLRRAELLRLARSGRTVRHPL